MTNGDEIDPKPNPCRTCKSKNNVMILSAGRSQNNTFIVECGVCHNSSPILSRTGAIERWNEENKHDL